MLPYQEKIPYKRTNNTPREHHRTPRDPPKLHFIAPRKVTKWQQNYKRKWERMRESGERFWYNGVTVKTSCQNEEKGLLFKGRKEERLTLDELQVSPIQERENKSRKRHF